MFARRFVNQILFANRTKISRTSIIRVWDGRHTVSNRNKLTREKKRRNREVKSQNIRISTPILPDPNTIRPRYPNIHSTTVAALPDASTPRFPLLLTFISNIRSNLPPMPCYDWFTATAEVTGCLVKAAIFVEHLFQLKPRFLLHRLL